MKQNMDDATRHKSTRTDSQSIAQLVAMQQQYNQVRRSVLADVEAVADERNPKPSKNKSATGTKAAGGDLSAADATGKLPRQRKDASAAKRARRSEIEKQSRQRHMVRQCLSLLLSRSCHVFATLGV